MGCVYKILAKLIANRMRKMRKVLGKMIDYCLSVFTGGGNFYIDKEIAETTKKTLVTEIITLLSQKDMLQKVGPI